MEKTEGKKDTKDKVDYSCIPLHVLDSVARVFEGGSKKYGGRLTWLPGIKFSKLCSAIVRHLVAWYWLREDVDIESGESHLSHIIANCMMLLSYIDNKNFDDRPRKQVSVRCLECGKTNGNHLFGCKMPKFD